MTPFTTQEEKLFEELRIAGVIVNDRDDETYIHEESPEYIKSFLHSHDQRLIDYLLEKLPEKSPNNSQICQNRNGLDYCETCEQAWGYCSCAARNTGFNSALSATRKLLEDCKKEL